MNPPELVIDGMVATITLRRPAQANRLNGDDLAVLVGQLARIDADEAVRVLRLRAQGRHFCSGYDISQLGQSGGADFEAFVNALEDVRPVTIAALQGSVYGGATDLALACDFRIGARGIDMFMPAARLGLHFYRRGLERYVTRLGLDQAKRLFLTAERIDAEEMKAIGFLTQLTEPAALGDAVEALTATCGALAPIAMRGMKHHLNRIARGALDVDALQRDIGRAAGSDDLQEGLRAFAEKRPPLFRGR